MDRIAKLSRVSRQAFQIILVLLPLFVAYFWVTVGTDYDILTEMGLIHLSLQGFTHPLTISGRVALTLTSLLVTCVPVYALMKLIKLFRNYEKGDIFCFENTRIYRQLAMCLFYWVIASVLYGTVIKVVDSLTSSQDSITLSLSLHDDDVLILILGVITLLISWVMQEAQKIYEDNKYVV